MAQLCSQSRVASAAERAAIAGMKRTWFASAGGASSRKRKTLTGAAAGLDNDDDHNAGHDVFMGCNPVTLEQRHTVADTHWATWKVDGLHCQLVQFRRRPPRHGAGAAKQQGKLARFGEAPPRPPGSKGPDARGNDDDNQEEDTADDDVGTTMPPFDERMFFVFRNGSIRVIDAGTCADRGTWPVLFTGRNGVGPVVLDGELAWRMGVTPPADATPLERTALAERLAAWTRNSYSWQAPPPSVSAAATDEIDRLFARCQRTWTLCFVCCDCLCFGSFVGSTPKLQTRLSLARECIDGRDPRDPPALEFMPPTQPLAGPQQQQQQCDVQIIYKPHMAPANVAAVALDVPPCLVGIALDGVIFTPAKGAHAPGTNYSLYKCKPPRLQSIDLVCASFEPARALAWLKMPSQTTSAPAQYVQASVGAQHLARRIGEHFARQQQQQQRDLVLEIAPTSVWRDAATGESSISWGVLRVRDDKPRGNAPLTVAGVIGSILAPVPYPGASK